MTISARSLPAKSRILCFFAAVALLIPGARAQSRSYKDADQVRKTVGKAVKAADKPGRTVKASVWKNLGRAYEDAFQFPLSNLSLGEGNSVRTLVVKGQRPREIMAPTGLEGVYKNVYSDKDIYFDGDGNLLAIRVTRPVLDTVDVLFRAYEAYAKAGDGEGLARISSEYGALAGMAERLGEKEEAERLYLRSALAGTTPPCVRPDTTALRVAAAVAERERAAAAERARLEALKASARHILERGERLYEDAMKTLKQATELGPGEDRQYQRLQEQFVRELRAAAVPLEECLKVTEDASVRSRAEDLLGGIRLFFAVESLDNLHD